MCGIVGFNDHNLDLIEKMTDSLAHRGPDDRGVFLDGTISLGHRRLAILDISDKAHQPMIFQHLILVYNGEIYNFRDIRRLLESEGYIFQSDSDTEVLLKSYHRWGPDCVERFNGMWAFCIYDQQQRILFLSRDRFGIKPLYYYYDQGRFFFASELKTIRLAVADLNIDSIALNFFFYQKYIGDDRTIYDKCKKLRPAENLIFDLDKKTLQRTPYYRLDQEIKQAADIPLAKRLSQIPDMLTDAVNKRLIADVPVGGFLSGGLDSSLISAIIAKTNQMFDTFSIGFEQDSYDEVPYSKIVARHIHTRHHVDYLPLNESLIEEVIPQLDEPFGDASILPTALLSKMTRRHVTVALSGDGGDELFAGYDAYQAYKIAHWIPAGLIHAARPLLSQLPPSDKKLSITFKMKKFVRDYHHDIQKRHLDWMATFTDIERKKIIPQVFVPSEQFLAPPKGSDLLSLQCNDFRNYLPNDILKKVDTASMLHSLEVRVPFLDHRLVPLVLSLPESYKIKFLMTKRFLKKMAQSYLPKTIIHRKKRGFTVPVSQWIRNSKLIHDVLTDPSCFQHNLLDLHYVNVLLDQHLQKRKDNARLLWLVFVFNYWYTTFK